MSIETVASNARSWLALAQKDFKEMANRHVENIKAQIVALCNEQGIDYICVPKPHFINPAYHGWDKTTTNDATLALLELVEWSNNHYGFGRSGSVFYIPKFPRQNYRSRSGQWEDLPPPPREPYSHPCR